MLGECGSMRLCVCVFDSIGKVDDESLMLLRRGMMCPSIA